jgi:hypothetical protein
MRMRLLITVFVVAGTAAGTAAGGALGNGGPSPGVLRGWTGVLAPGGDVRYVALPAGRSTVVASVRVRGGRVVRFASLLGSFGVPLVAYDGTAGGLSADGRTLVLGSTAVGFRASSRFAVLNAKSLRREHVVALPGTFSFDALSPDASRLYLVEHLSARDAVRYRVRAYDLVRGRLLPRPVVDRSSRTAEMRGSPAARVATRDGGWAYTLYLGGQHPFVHALETRRGEAICIDLPWHGSQEGLSRMRLALSADERRLLLRDRSSGRRVMAIDTRTFRVVARLTK